MLALLMILTTLPMMMGFDRIPLDPDLEAEISQPITEPTQREYINCPWSGEYFFLDPALRGESESIDESDLRESLDESSLVDGTFAERSGSVVAIQQPLNNATVTVNANRQFQVRASGTNAHRLLVIVRRGSTASGPIEQWYEAFNPLSINVWHTVPTTASLPSAYRIEVISQNANGGQLASWVHNITVNPPSSGARPSTVRNFNTTSVSATSISFTWTAPASGQASGYQIEVLNEWYEQQFVNTTAMHATANNLRPNLRHFVRIRAHNANGDFGPWGCWYQLWTHQAPPGVPGNLRVDGITANSATLRWNAPSGGATGYTVELWCTVAGAVIRPNINVGNSTFTTQSDLVANRQYYFRVRARNGAGSGAWSGWVDFWTSNAPTTVTVSSWAQLRDAVNGTATTINISAGFSAPTDTTGNAITIPTGRNITLVGQGGERVINQTNNGQRHFNVDGTLILGNNTTLRGGTATNSNNSGGIYVRSGGQLTMNAGSIIENCRRTGANGGAVRLRGTGTVADTRATFTMNNGTIRNNSAPIGGGVEVTQNSRMNMSSGTINVNSATTNGGGGVHVSSGTIANSQGFNMTGGTVLNNTAMSNGGGIYSSLASTAVTLPTTAYANLNIGANARFSGNRATAGASAPPTNILGHVASINATVWRNPLNNYDIGYGGRIGHTPLESGQTYLLKNLHSNLFMTTTGTNIEQRDWRTDRHIVWELIDDGEGFFRIRDVNSGRFVTSPEGTAGGLAITLESAFTGAARNRQRWLFTLQSDNTYTIRAENRNTFVLSIDSNSTSNGIRITQRSPDDGRRTRWNIALSDVFIDAENRNRGASTRTFTLRQTGDVTSQDIWQTAINDSVAAWNNSGAGTNISTVTTGNSPHTIVAEARIGVTWFGQFSPQGIENQTGFVTSSIITLNTRTLPTDNTQLSRERRQRTTVHEIGHLLWFRDNPPVIRDLSIMNQGLDGVLVPTAFDVRNVRYRYD